MSDAWAYGLLGAIGGYGDTLQAQGVASREAEAESLKAKEDEKRAKRLFLRQEEIREKYRKLKEKRASETEQVRFERDEKAKIEEEARALEAYKKKKQVDDQYRKPDTKYDVGDDGIQYHVVDGVAMQVTTPGPDMGEISQGLLSQYGGPTAEAGTAMDAELADPANQPMPFRPQQKAGTKPLNPQKTFLDRTKFYMTPNEYGDAPPYEQAAAMAIRDMNAVGIDTSGINIGVQGGGLKQEYVGPGGRVVPMSAIEETARNRGKTVEQVINELGLR